MLLFRIVEQQAELQALRARLERQEEQLAALSARPR